MKKLRKNTENYTVPKSAQFPNYQRCRPQVLLAQFQDFNQDCVKFYVPIFIIFQRYKHLKSVWAGLVYLNICDCTRSFSALCTGTLASLQRIKSLQIFSLIYIHIYIYVYIIYVQIFLEKYSYLLRAKRPSKRGSSFSRHMGSKMNALKSLNALKCPEMNALKMVVEQFCKIHFSSFCTQNLFPSPGPTVTLFDVLFIGNYKIQTREILTQSAFKSLFVLLRFGFDIFDTLETMRFSTTQ